MLFSSIYNLGYFLSIVVWLLQKEVDYSGLRVQAMQISEKEEDEVEKREDPSYNWEEGGGGGGGVEKSSGPWNKTAPVQAPPAPVVGNLNISFS